MNTPDNTLEQTDSPYNPLLTYTLANEGLVPFDQFQPDQVQPAVQTLLTQAQAALEAATQPDFSADWQALGKTLDVATERLGKAWGIVNHLAHVADTPALREVYNATLPLVSQFWAELGANEKLYAKYKTIDAKTLPPAAQSALAHALRNFVLGGSELQGNAKVRFTKIQEALSALMQKFSENVLDATDAFIYYASATEVVGLPADVQKATQQAAQADGKKGYKLSLKQPVYIPVMQFAQNRALRERLYRAYVTRASELGAQSQDNSHTIEQILALRQEASDLLGFTHYAAYSLSTKMAQSPAQVEAFLRDLSTKARPFAQDDLAQMRTFAAQQLGLSDPQPWDWAFIAERIKEARYAFNDQEVKNYFQLPKVLNGLFSLIHTLFGVTFSQSPAPVWHPDVRFYEVKRNNQLIAHFYLDPTARNGKRGGAWMDSARDRWLRPDSECLQTPIAYLVCNFAAGLDGKPALLTHDDVLTLFHEMGHGLHHMLTTVDEAAVAGINAVEWDAVELPSQFMENFAWEKSVLQGMSAHIETGASLPDTLYEKMLAAKNFQTGLQTLRQVEFALFDILLHAPVPSQTAQGSKSHTLKTLTALQHQVHTQIAVLPKPDYSRTAHSFSHIFAGGYAAGYYSYKWAEVLSADAYSAFEEHGHSMGQAFLREFLSVGATRPALESFIAFRGRAPQMDALLRHQGMQEPTKTKYCDKAKA